MAVGRGDFECELIVVDNDIPRLNLRDFNPPLPDNHTSFSGLGLDEVEVDQGRVDGGWAATTEEGYVGEGAGGGHGGERGGWGADVMGDERGRELGFFI